MVVGCMGRIFEARNGGNEGLNRERQKDYHHFSPYGLRGAESRTGIGGDGGGTEMED